MDFLTDAARFIDPGALALVAGGTIASAMLRSTRADLAGAVRALGPLLAADPQRDALDARRALHAVALRTERTGIACADRVETRNRFARQAALRLADAESGEAFARWAAADIAGRARRHQAAIGVWRAAADAAPAMGMIGTVVGLIGMFATIDDMSRIGAFMAVAMLTTLYGLVIGAGIAGPIADRLARLDAAEREWQSDLADGLQRLAGANPAEAWPPLQRRARA